MHDTTGIMTRINRTLCVLVCAVTCATYADTDSGQVYLYNGELERAVAHYWQALQEKPHHLHFHRFYQDACMGQGDKAQAKLVAWYELLARKHPQRALYQYLWGRCLDCQQAVEHFGQALKLDPRFAWALNAQGACCYEANDFAGAKEKFLKAIKADRDFGEAYRNLARTYVRMGQAKKAKRVFRKLIRRQRKHPKPYEWLGDMYLEQKQYQFASRAYQKSVEKGTRDPSVFFKLGYCLFKGKKFQEAVQAYKQSLLAGNRRFDAYYNLGACLEMLEYPEEALEHYQAAFDLAGDSTVLYPMGNCAVSLGLYSKAIDCYTGFLAKFPNHAEAMFGLANAFQLKRDFERAEDTYQQVLQLDPRFAKAYYNLGSIYAYHLKDIGKMKRYWQKFMALSPDRNEIEFIQEEMQKFGKEIVAEGL